MKAIAKHVIPDIQKWPIALLSNDRKKFIVEIVDETLSVFLKMPLEKQKSILTETVYLERIRIKEEPWKVDPPKQGKIFRAYYKQLSAIKFQDSDDKNSDVYADIYRKIITAYAEEIVGSFRGKTYLFARRFLTWFFSKLLNTAASRNFRRIYSSKYRLQDKLIVNGDIDKIQSVFKDNVVVVVPTHFSNLDSIIVGYGMDVNLGLPSFSYGAGLNLYNTGIVAYFMNRLGAYRVDRRKKNKIYLQTLKNMSMLSIVRGTNSLFFPGGTRSRSGAIEDSLKLGLLNTAIQSQRVLLKKKENKKVIILPLIIGYNCTLEAKHLIEQELRKTGKEKYINAKDDSYSPWKLAKYLWQFFSVESDINLSFAPPIDIFGNEVNSKGESLGKSGEILNIKDYFINNESFNVDSQREFEYTKQLSNIIVEKYHKYNVVLLSHFVTFIAFNIFQAYFKNVDLFSLLRLPIKGVSIERSSFNEVANNALRHLKGMAIDGKLILEPHFNKDLNEIIEEGISKVGVYHEQSPLKILSNNNIASGNFNTLFYYHNRLLGYQLEDDIDWSLGVVIENLKD